MKLTKLRVGAVGALSALAAAGVATTAFGAPAGVPDKGVVYFATTHAAGGTTFAAGNATDKLFGAEAVTYSIKTAPTPTGTVKIIVKHGTIWGKAGTLTGSATATLTVTDPKTGASTLTNGKLKAAKGTGAWIGHSITATFSGAGNVVTGQYKITYKGTYK